MLYLGTSAPLPLTRPRSQTCENVNAVVSGVPGGEPGAAGVMLHVNDLLLQMTLFNRPGEVPLITAMPAICGFDCTFGPSGNDCRLVAVLALLATVLLTRRTPFASDSATPPPA